jgi:hypothetical protein
MAIETVTSEPAAAPTGAPATQPAKKPPSPPRSRLLLHPLCNLLLRMLRLPGKVSSKGVEKVRKSLISSGHDIRAR